MNLLIVDKNTESSAFLRGYFNDQNYTVKILDNHRCLLDWLECNDCDIVVLCPATITTTETALIRTTCVRHPKLKFFVYIGSSYDADLERICRTAGAHGYVPRNLGHYDLHAEIVKRVPGAT